MSFFSDLFEGNFSNLGTDITHAPSSFINHPADMLETGAAVLGALTLGASLPETAGLFGAADVGLGAADLGAADLGVAADLGGVGEAAAAGGDLATSLGIGDIGSAALSDAALGSLPADVASSFGAEVIGTGDVGAAELAGDITGVAGGDVGTAVGDVGGGGFDLSAPADTGVAAAPATTADATAAAPGAANVLPTGPTGVDVQPASLDAANKAFGTFNPGTFTTNAINAGTEGFGSQVLNALGGWGGATKLALGAAPLALTLGMGQPGLPSSAQALQAQANALSAQGQQDLANARAGILNPGQTAQLSQMSLNLKNQWLQTLANQGVKDPTKDARWPEILAQIDSQVTQATTQMIQNNITNALAETGQASQALTSIANMQLSSDQNFTNALINSTKALGMAAGSSSGGFKIVQA